MFPSVANNVSKLRKHFCFLEEILFSLPCFPRWTNRKILIRYIMFLQQCFLVCPRPKFGVVFRISKFRKQWHEWTACKLILKIPGKVSIGRKLHLIWAISCLSFELLYLRFPNVASCKLDS